MAALLKYRMVSNQILMLNSIQPDSPTASNSIYMSHKKSQKGKKDYISRKLSRCLHFFLALLAVTPKQTARRDETTRTSVTCSASALFHDIHPSYRYLNHTPIFLSPLLPSSNPSSFFRSLNLFIHLIFLCTHLFLQSIF